MSKVFTGNSLQFAQIDLHGNEGLLFQMKTGRAGFSRNTQYVCRWEGFIFVSKVYIADKTISLCPNIRDKPNMDVDRYAYVLYEGTGIPLQFLDDLYMINVRKLNVQQETAPEAQPGEQGSAESPDGTV